MSAPTDPTSDPSAVPPPAPYLPPPPPGYVDPTAAPAAPTQSVSPAPPAAYPATAAYQSVPGYPPPGYGVAGYAPPGYGTPGFGVRAPGSVTTAAVLAYINSGLMFLCGLFLTLAGALFNDIMNEVGFIPGGDTLRAVFFVMAVVPIALGVLLIVSARQLQRGSNRAFLITIASIISVLVFISLINAITGNNAQPNQSTGGSIVLNLLLLALSASPIFAAASATTGQWIDLHRGQPLR